MDLLNSNLNGKNIILRTDFNVPILNNNIQSTKTLILLYYKILF